MTFKDYMAQTFLITYLIKDGEARKELIPLLNSV